ncbi:substrate-binding periplasmic protein [Maridesulfovibrio sp.]|uniref:substrate-binding periplasmic protein n=1 Tax=unclassified Maridesulfovibrio TaxID=2794999 RepID=UPI003AFFAA7C
MKVLKYFFIISIGWAALFMFASTAWVAEPIIVSSVIYPPLVFEKETPGFGEGMLRDIVTEAFRVEGADVEYSLLPMSRNVWSIASKVGDCCLGAMEWFERSGLADEVEPVDIIKLKFVAFYKVKNFPDGIDFERLEELQGYSFGNVRGSSSQRTLDAAGLETDLVRNIRLNFMKLEVGRFDFAISFHVTGEYLIWDLFPDKEAEFSYLGKPIQEMTLSVIFQKRQRGMREKFTKGLEKIARDGTYYSILKRYHVGGYVPDEIIPDTLRGIAKH